ncbi:hypothetical protein D3C75_1139460 [compost metagenome]
MHTRRPVGQRSVVPRLRLQGLQYCIQAGTACIGQKATLGRCQTQLIDQNLRQTMIGWVFGDFHIAPGKVAKNGLEDLTDHQRAGLCR